MTFRTIDGGAATEYVGARNRFAEFEVDLYGDDLLKMLHHGDPIPSRVLRWLALEYDLEVTRRVYTGERRAQEVAAIEKAQKEQDSYSLLIQCDFDVTDDGEAENIRNVEIGARITNTRPGADTWESLKVKEPSQWLYEWLKERATEEVCK